jgi:hypothetical protein
MIRLDRMLFCPAQGDSIREKDNERGRDQTSLLTRDENGLCTNASALFPQNKRKRNFSEIWIGMTGLG